MGSIIEARFGYAAEYKGRLDRVWHRALLGDTAFIRIDDVPSVDAPTAYRIFSGDPWDEPFEVRLHGGRLWWPLYGNHGQLTSQAFLGAAANDWETAAAILDPLGRTFDGVRQTYEQFFGQRGVKAFRSDHASQKALVNTNAARLLFIDGRVHAEAGEPVWYAVFNRTTRSSFDLLIGPSALDRLDRKGCRMPCVDRGTRLTAARLGRAFGLDELDELLPRLHADEIHKVSEITPAGNHVPGPAAAVCATAWAHYLWDVASKSPNLRRLLPALHGAKANSPPPADLPYRELLQRFASNHEVITPWRLPLAPEDADLLLTRLIRSDCTLETDATLLTDLFALDEIDVSLGGLPDTGEDPHQLPRKRNRAASSAIQMPSVGR